MNFLRFLLIYFYGEIMYIKRLLKKLLLDSELIVNNHYIKGIKDDSRLVVENDVFFAIKGGQTDGKNYIEEAISKGAKTIVCEGKIKKEHHNINYIEVTNIKRILALFCKYFYKDITKKIKMIAVIGTNGKTTISTMLFDYISYSGYDSILIGTNGIYYRDEHFHTSNTTPNIIETYNAINEAYKKGLKFLIMEVSSIGVRECRVMYFDFDIIIFTNLTHDHLDYHKNITDYKYSKAILLWDLEYKNDKCVIINSDDENYLFFTSMIKSNIITYSINNDSQYKAKNIKKSLTKTEFQIENKNNEFYIKSFLVGGFNIYNLLAIFSCIDFLNLDVEQFIEFLKIYICVSGRMNKIIYKNKTIIVDFAHTPSSVENVLTNIIDFSNNKITLVIGCGGNRDKAKRKVIADIAIKYASKVIFTTDNPRDEDPIEIINDMISKIPCDKYEVYLDRKEAILRALNDNTKDEVILLLGKGSEPYQIANGIKYPFSDKKVVYDWINKMSEK